MHGAQGAKLSFKMSFWSLGFAPSLNCDLNENNREDSHKNISMQCCCCCCCCCCSLLSTQCSALFQMGI